MMNNVLLNNIAFAQPFLKHPSPKNVHAKKNLMTTSIDEHLTVNVMLFNHLDKEKREKITIDDISRGMKDADSEHLRILKRDWKDTNEKFNEIDSKNKGSIDFQQFLKLIDRSEAIRKLRDWYFLRMNEILQPTNMMYTRYKGKKKYYCIRGISYYRKGCSN